MTVLFKLIILLLLISPSCFAATCEDITSNGITWNFSGTPECGQFITGDWWVVDAGSGVEISSISPAYTASPRQMNGSMINPSSETEQGYDAFSSYNTNLNDGKSMPLTIDAGDSLISGDSNATPDGVYVALLETCAILTCLSAAPTAGADAFRPPYSDATKTIYDYGDVATDKLASLAVTGIPSFSTYAGYFERPLLAHLVGATASRVLMPDHPNLPNDFNYYQAEIISNAALMLHDDETLANKKDLLVGYLQFGIDLYGIIESGQDGWQAQAGFGHAKKWPILFAGIMFNDSNMKAVAEKSGDYADDAAYGAVPADYIYFAEDALTFYVTQDDVDCTGDVTCTWDPDDRDATSYVYSSAMIGMPEWCQTGIENPENGDSQWGAIYRDIYSGPPYWAGFALAARIMGAKGLWDHNAFFDYCDRYMAIAAGESDPFGYTVEGETSGGGPGGIIQYMWDTYRDNYSDPTMQGVSINN